MSPRPQIDHIRKPQILAAAAEVIGERGVAATRISDVADRAGTSAGAVLYWFGSKDELLAEALTYEEMRFQQELGKRLAEGYSPAERLVLLIDAASGDSDWKLWIELWTRALRDLDAASTRERLERSWRSEIARIVRDGQEVGDFAATADVDDFAALLGALLDGLAVQVNLGDPEMPPARMTALAREVAEERLDCILPAATPVEPVAV